MLAAGRTVPPELGSGRPVTLCVRRRRELRAGARRPAGDGSDVAAEAAAAAPVLSAAESTMVNGYRHHRPGRAGGQGVHVPGPGDGLPSLAAGGLDIVEPGQQPRGGLRPRWLGRHPRRCSRLRPATAFRWSEPATTPPRRYCLPTCHRTRPAHRVPGRHPGSGRQHGSLDRRRGAAGTGGARRSVTALGRGGALRPQVDTMVVFLHWGTEMEERTFSPDPAGRQLVDATRTSSWEAMRTSRWRAAC